MDICDATDDLSQGGMELPCTFSGDPGDLLKVKRIMTTISIWPPPKQASSDEPEQEWSDSDTTSNQPLDPAEAMELDAAKQHAKLWIKIEDIHLIEVDKLILMEGGNLATDMWMQPEDCCEHNILIWKVSLWQW